MFEVKNRFNYEPFGGINPDLNTWKKYDMNMTKNQQGMNEIQVDLSDAVLNGTSDSFEDMLVVEPRFQVGFKKKQFQLGVIDACRNNLFSDISNCTDDVDLNLVNTVNKIITYYTED